MPWNFIPNKFVEGLSFKIFILEYFKFFLSKNVEKFIFLSLGWRFDLFLNRSIVLNYYFLKLSQLIISVNL